jgi:hypothetical protein
VAPIFPYPPPLDPEPKMFDLSGTLVELDVHIGKKDEKIR